MKIIEDRPMSGKHNGTQDSMALPVPSIIKGQGVATISWSTHKGSDGRDIHSVNFGDEDGKFIASHTLSDDEVRPWDKVLFILTKFRKNALVLLDKLNLALCQP